MLLIPNMNFILIEQVFIGAMGPPGGGRNDISSRMTRHLQVFIISLLFITLFVPYTYNNYKAQYCHTL